MAEENFQALQDAIYREKVARARKMTIGERLAAGPALFAESAARMKIGIRIKNPDADEAEVTQLLKTQLDRLTAWQERDIYQRG